jgi:hypothetical protein
MKYECLYIIYYMIAHEQIICSDLNDICSAEPNNKKCWDHIHENLGRTAERILLEGKILFEYTCTGL